MSGLRTAAGTVAGLALGLVGALLSTAFIALMLGGGVYRTECVSMDGFHTVSWGLEGDIPYLWDPGRGCVAHTLTRYVLGKAGLESDVAG